jgi:hypothetical protein
MVEFNAAYHRFLRQQQPPVTRQAKTVFRPAKISEARRGILYPARRFPVPNDFRKKLAASRHQNVTHGFSKRGNFSASLGCTAFTGFEP